MPSGLSTSCWAVLQAALELPAQRSEFVAPGVVPFDLADLRAEPIAERVQRLEQAAAVVDEVAGRVAAVEQHDGQAGTGGACQTEAVEEAVGHAR